MTPTGKRAETSQTSTKIQTLPGHALPPQPHHSITVHLPGWQNLLRFADRDMELLSSLKSMYPRMMIHRDIKELATKILENTKSEGQNCLLFVSQSATDECVAFVTSPARKDDRVPADELQVRVFDIADVRLFAVFFPLPKTPLMMPFWSHPGLGMSSRLAEETLKHVENLEEVSADSAPPSVSESPAHVVLRERIAGLLERAPTDPPRKKKVQPEDVYLFQTGMASIYLSHRYLLSKFGGTTVLFGYAFHSTIHVFEDYGPGSKLLGLGTSEEIDLLEAHLESETEGKKVQAVWCEFPSNPLLVTPDLGRLRALADRYGILLVVDDTVASFCNVDVMGVADIVVTSLTKSFSGYADVMGACAVLNPSSSRYTELKELFTEKYTNHMYSGDASVLVKNSENYLSRSKTLNNNSATLASYFQSQISNPKSSICSVYYPSLSPSKANYDSRMRKKTSEFTPGYGCLLSIEFDSMEAMAAFYDNLNVHHGPHLGAHLTLAIPYVKVIYAKELDAAARYGLRPTQFRIAPGLEDIDELLEDFKVALKAADEVKAKVAEEPIAVEL